MPRLLQPKSRRETDYPRTDHDDVGAAVYLPIERSQAETRYGFNPNRAPPPGRRPAEVIERPFAEAAEAIAALEKGEIDA